MMGKVELKGNLIATSENLLEVTLSPYDDISFEAFLPEECKKYSQK